MIYLDYNATTPVDEQVLQEMLPYFTAKFGNAASNTHLPGMAAKNAVEQARVQIAQFIGCDTQEIIFTSGATESLNLAIKGVFNLYQNKGNHIITAVTEHKAVLDTCKFLEKKGAHVTYLPVNENGLIDVQELQNAITSKTILVAIMCANNETGVLQPITQIASVAHAHQAIFLSDTTQAIGKIPVNVATDCIDLLCISAHKIYGPKGVGALYVRRKNPRVSLEPLIHGGGHERGWRSGTLNVPSIIGLAKACSIANTATKTEELRDYFEHELLLKFQDKIQINGKLAQRLPNTSNITFPFKATDFIHHTKNILAIATGSACTSAENTPSHVLLAMGLTKYQAERTIRFSLGKYTTKDEIHQVISMIDMLMEKY